MSTIHDSHATGDFSGRDLGSTDYVDCSFSGTPMRNAHLESSTFVRCDFTESDIRRSVWRLSCAMGSGNKIDIMNAVAFLYWFNHFFDLPDDIKPTIEAIIQPYKRRLAILFSEEV